MIIEHKTTKEHIVIDTFKREIYLWHTNETISFEDVVSTRLAVICSKSQLILSPEGDFLEIKTNKNQIINIPVIRAQVEEIEKFFDVGYYNLFDIVHKKKVTHSEEIKKKYKAKLIGNMEFGALVCLFIFLIIIITACFILDKTMSIKDIINASFVVVVVLLTFIPKLIKSYKKEASCKKQ